MTDQSDQVEIVEVYVKRKSNGLFTTTFDGKVTGVNLCDYEVVGGRPNLLPLRSLRLGDLFLDTFGQGWVTDTHNGFLVARPVDADPNFDGVVLTDRTPKGPLTLLAREGNRVDDVVMFA